MESKDLADEMGREATEGERGNGHVGGKALLDVPVLLGHKPELPSAPNSKQSQQNHPDELVNPQTQKVILSVATWLVFRPSCCHLLLHVPLPYQLPNE